MDDPELIKRLNALTFQIGVLERKVDFLLAHTGARFVDQKPPPNEFERMILAGDRLGAMKAYQQKHGANLLDAKRAIEEMAAKLGV
jgi:hypothetical protein